MVFGCRFGTTVQVGDVHSMAEMGGHDERERGQQHKTKLELLFVTTNNKNMIKGVLKLP